PRIPSQECSPPAARALRIARASNTPIRSEKGECASLAYGLPNRPLRAQASTGDNSACHPGSAKRCPGPTHLLVQDAEWGPALRFAAAGMTPVARCEIFWREMR